MNKESINIFKDGLVMDFNPLVTPNTVLTNCLNGTMITYNGNEGILLNDMGNGRVETAFLPEGYVPLGTCEFGDIVYIISYNPLINKALIGCFPSPERNISSEEVTDLLLSITVLDFQKINEDKVEDLTNTSVNKILYNKKISPGDKFIIYTDLILKSVDNLINNDKYLSGYSGNKTVDGFPKIMKIKVILFLDDGKTIDLTNNIKWYKDYYIELQKSDSNSPDIDSYRNLLSSGYSVLLSKHSGKLGVQAELEKISSFSCAHKIYNKGTVTETKELRYSIDDYTTSGMSTIYYDEYEIWMDFYWQTPNKDVNPIGYCVKDNNLVECTINSDSSKISASINTEEPIKNEVIVDWSLGNKVCDDEFIIGYRIDDCINTNLTYENFSNNYTHDKLVDDFYTQRLINNISLSDIHKSSYSLVRDIDSNGIPKVGQILLEENPKNVHKNNLKDLYLFNPTLINNLIKYLHNNKESVNSSECNSVYAYDNLVVNEFNRTVLKKFKTLKIPTRIEVKGIDTKDTDKILIYNTNLSKGVYEYTIVPKMPYGTLDSLKCKGVIDFYKLNSNLIELNSFSYYNSGDNCTIKFSINNYLNSLNGLLTEKMLLKFYDNLGCAATYTISNRNSYSGLFIENLILNSTVSFDDGTFLKNLLYNDLYEDFTTFKYRDSGNTKDIHNNLLHIHAGNKIENSTDHIGVILMNYAEYHKEDYKLNENTLLDEEVSHESYNVLLNTPIYKSTVHIKKQDKLDTYDTYNAYYFPNGELLNSNDLIVLNKRGYSCYENNYGYIVSNCLYNVEIVIYNGYANALGVVQSIPDLTKIFSRWMWTNEIFNEYYYTVDDFESLKPELTFDINVSYKSDVLLSLNIVINEDSIGSTILKFTTEYDKYINIDNVLIGLLNTYNTFSLVAKKPRYDAEYDENSIIKVTEKDIKIDVALGEYSWEDSNENPGKISLNNTLLEDSNLSKDTHENEESSLVDFYSYSNTSKSFNYIEFKTKELKTASLKCLERTYYDIKEVYFKSNIEFSSNFLVNFLLKLRTANLFRPILNGDTLSNIYKLYVHDGSIYPLLGYVAILNASDGKKDNAWHRVGCASGLNGRLVVPGYDTSKDTKTKFRSSLLTGTSIENANLTVVNAFNPLQTGFVYVVLSRDSGADNMILTTHWNVTDGPEVRQYNYMYHFLGYKNFDTLVTFNNFVYRLEYGVTGISGGADTIPIVHLNKFASFFYRIYTKEQLLFDCKTTVDYLYFEPYYTIFSKDIVYKVSRGPRTESKDYLCINDLYLPMYIESIERKSKKPDVDNNINIVINDITKTIPIQIKFNYIKPDTTKEYYNDFIFEDNEIKVYKKNTPADQIGYNSAGIFSLKDDFIRLDQAYALHNLLNQIPELLPYYDNWLIKSINYVNCLCATRSDLGAAIHLNKDLWWLKLINLGYTDRLTVGITDGDVNAAPSENFYTFIVGSNKYWPDKILGIGRTTRLLDDETNIN